MTDSEEHPHHHDQPDKGLALSFGRAVADYERGRPDYPAAAVDWILGHLRVGSGSVDAVDIGAGTGKFTRALVAAGARVTAVEPIPEMRAQLAANLPDITVREGFAESTGLPDASADLVTFAQSWHWVDVEPASSEVARVLRPRGILALIWNVRDRSVPWLAALEEITGESPAERYDSLAPAVAAPFIRSDFAEFGWSTTLTHDELFAMVTSRSNIITMPDDERAAVLERLDARLSTDPALAGRSAYEVPYLTRVTIAAQQL